MVEGLISDGICRACGHPPFATDEPLRVWDYCTWCGFLVLPEALSNLADALNTIGYSQNGEAMPSKKKEELKFSFPLVVGDWSNDGHGETDYIMVSTNKSHEDVEKAYKKGTRLLCFDLSKEVAKDYQDYKLPEDCRTKLSLAGAVLEGRLDGSEKAGYTLNTQTFAELYMTVAGMGDLDLKWVIVSSYDTPRINIGGYGLFD